MDNLTVKCGGKEDYMKRHSIVRELDGQQADWGMEETGLRHGRVSGDSTSKGQRSCRDLQHLSWETPFNGLA